MSTTGGPSRARSTCSTSPDAIRRKFKRAVADSGREIVRAADKPGISNMIEIMAVARGISPEQVEREFEGSGYGDFKAAVADAVVDWLAPVRERYEELRADDARLEGDPRGRRRQGARDRLGHAGRRARRDGRRARPAVRRACRLAFRVRVATIAHRLELDLDAFTGPFDLLLSLILREELDLLEVELAEIVIAYIDHLEAEGELDLEAATEFLVLIAALLELKSRLMLPARSRSRSSTSWRPPRRPRSCSSGCSSTRASAAPAAGPPRPTPPASRTCTAAAPLPPALRRVSVEVAERAYDAAVLGQAVGSLLRTPPPLDLRHMAMPRVSVADRLAHLRGLLARRSGRFSFDEAVQGADRVTVAVTLFALLELYKARRGRVGAGRAVRADHDPGSRMNPSSRARSRRSCSSRPSPSRWTSWPTPCRRGRRPSSRRWPSSREALDGRGVVLREVGGGWALASHPDAEEAARRLLARPRTPALTPAQAETLAIVGYLQPVSRPEVARIRGVASESATAALVERGLIEESGRSQFGAILYRTTPLFLKLFGLNTLDELPEIEQWDPSPEDEAALRERLLRAGEARLNGPTPPA